MKSIIVNLLSLTVAVVMLSCADEETHCFTCQTSESGQITEFTRCDITQKEADQIERSGSVIDPESKHSYVVKMLKSTRCEKQ